MRIVIDYKDCQLDISYCFYNEVMRIPGLSEVPGCVWLEAEEGILAGFRV